ncbi:MAG: NAD(P)-dependent oxidoreductase [Nocardioidaceae bacterium]
MGLGHLGANLAGSLLRAGHDLVVLDLDPEAAAPLLEAGADRGSSPAEMALRCDLVITCLPSPAASAEVVEGPEGLLGGLHEGSVWVEMSTTDETEVRRLASRVAEVGATAADCPVSGGCHRAASGNISIFAGCDRPVFERLLPVLSSMGRDVLHTGPLGTASVLKVVTNYLATAHLAALAEALVTAAGAGMDLATTYEAIRISSGNSFVHETEGQVILNGSRDIGFTLDLVAKDLGLFQAVADRAGVPLELSPLLGGLVADAMARYGPREWSPNIIRRLEEATGLDVLAPGFPAQLVDLEPPVIGTEVLTRGVDIHTVGG